MGRRKGTHRRRRSVGALVVLGTLALGAAAYAADEPTGRIEHIELKTDGAATKVIIMLSRPLAFDVHVLGGDTKQKSARRLVLDFADTTLAPEVTKPIEVANDLLRQIRTGQFDARTARIVLELASDATHSVDAFEAPPHVTIALASATAAGTPPTAASDTSKPTIAASGAPKPTTGTARMIPIRARGRRPYSLLDSR